MVLKFYDMTFSFELVRNDDCFLICKLIFDEEKLRIYQDIVDQDHVWYLDDRGHRLETDELFEASPWTLVLDDLSEVKLLCRWGDIDGEFRFEKKENYFDWCSVLVNK